MVQVVDVEPSSPPSHELLPAWGGHTVEGSSLRKGLSLAPSAIPRCAIASSISLDDLLGNTNNSSSSSSSSFRPLGGGFYDSSTDGTSTPAASSVDDFFTWASPHEGMRFDFLEPTQATFQEPKRWKRIRHGQDVDGPNTASLSCKKRRLRTELITSRLSQPYSLPATHILNREGAKEGDKRFAKIATSYDVARRAAHLHATSFLRFSVMNRLRRRLGLGHPGQRVQVEEDARQSSQSRAPWQSSPTCPTVSAGAKHLRSSREALIASSARAMGHASFKVQTLLSQPAALPLPTCDLAAARKRTSPRIHPIRSPELHPERSSAYYEELDDDGLFYLHGDDCAGLSEDPEQVYSDFSVIFSNGTAAAAAEEDHSYEEYLDELDGISWVTI
ncbi:uncharacterized protein J7T54_007798 [Emericellopsis cladophorae]|uniref:Uncharacterized protein n=1 Tax=Emericellopsis cladophorae TaxID=2686198 RepID=A0A9P9Y7H0_9HYPO|nr:uncharacterized protein J7T54_007798 [Emericellopsis cladophorae]KAI6784705.1 hypothetical protein J7T54_007798 [Emericellopsis cladophorae]